MRTNDHVRLLNLGFSPAHPAAPAEPQVTTLDLHGHSVVFDSHSLCAIQATPPVAQRLLAARGHGLLHCTMRPAVEIAPAAIRAICLVLTHRCNLRCRYCFEHSYENRDRDLSFGDAARAIELLAPDGEAAISFFGGEPLLRFDLLRRIVEYASGKRDQVTFHLTTNGTLLTDEIARFLDAHGFSVIVSLDGDAATHDALRGRHAETMRGLAEFTGLAIASRTTLRSTFTAGEVALLERLRFLNALGAAGLAANVSVEPVSLPPEHPQAITSEHAALLAEEYHKAATWMVAEIREGRRPVFFHFDKLAGRIAFGSAAPTECGAGWHYVTVDPAGGIHACHREGARIGSVRKGIDPERAAQWADNSLRERCTHCWLRYVCGGGCRADSLQNCAGDFASNPRLAAPDPAMCALKEIMVREVLWMLCELTTEEARRWLNAPAFYERQVGWATWSAPFPSLAV